MSLWKERDRTIEDVETSGYMLEMAIEQKDDRSKDAQKSVKMHVRLVKELKKAKSTALQLGV